MMTKEKSKPDPGLKSVGDRLPSYWLDETKPSKLVEIPKRIAEMAPFSEKISCVRCKHRSSVSCRARRAVAGGRLHRYGSVLYVSQSRVCTFSQFTRVSMFNVLHNF